MRLEKYALIAEIFGGVAIVLSLIFVGLEVRENTRVTILTSDRSLDQQNLALNLAITNSADFAELLVRAELDRDSLTDEERARFDNYCFSRFGGYENVVANFAEGFVSDDEYNVWAEHFRYRFDKPGYRQFWIEYRSGYFSSFRAWADEQFGIAVD
jgi:hypothetical protein